jgi:hypothetical protein
MEITTIELDVVEHFQSFSRGSIGRKVQETEPLRSVGVALQDHLDILADDPFVFYELTQTILAHAPSQVTNEQLLSHAIFLSRDCPPDNH